MLKPDRGFLARKSFSFNVQSFSRRVVKRMWLLGFFLHEMAFGLLSIFLPLYIIGAAVGGTLIDVGIMISLATFLAIPFSFFWGYLCDKTGRYKRFILLSFFSMGILLYIFTLTANIVMLILLFAVITILHVAHESPKNVLIAESYSRPDWKKSFAQYELLTEIGWLIGLILGFLMSSQGFGASLILLFCGTLNLAAFLASAIFISDPPFIFERTLATMERTLSFAQRGIVLALNASDGKPIDDKIKKESLSVFCTGMVLFSLATSLLFTPLPIFFSKDLALVSSLVFAVFVMNSGGACLGYFVARRENQSRNEKGMVKRTTLLRGLLTLSLTLGILFQSTVTTLVDVAALVMLGFAYALFLASTLSVSMELLPQGKAGLFNVLIGIGGAVGSFIGPLMASQFGFLHVFLSSTAIFVSSFVAFKFFAD